ncbi:hypothetical protein [Pandoraea pneumonica]|nr:hypothetical protein [Pandoraea pneumonica]
MTALLLALLAQQPAMPQALPVAKLAMNRAIAGLITRVARERGFAANDPRIAATLETISSNSTALNVVSTGAGFGLSLMGAPVWLTILAGLGIFGAGNALLARLGDTEVSITATEAGTLTISTSRPQGPPPVLSENFHVNLTPGEDEWLDDLLERGYLAYQLPNCPVGDREYICSSLPSPPSVSSGMSQQNWWHGYEVVATSMHAFVQLVGVLLRNNDGSDPNPTIVEMFGPDGEFKEFGVRYWGHDYMNCPGSPSCTPYSWITVPLESKYVLTREAFERTRRTTTFSSHPNLDSAIFEIADEASTIPLSAETLAEIVDQVWQRAASSVDYQGLPYSVTEPVTAPEVMPWIRENPKSTPQIGDVMEPATLPEQKAVPISSSIRPNKKPDAETDPIAQPKLDPSEVQDVNVVNRPIVDIGNTVKAEVDLGAAPDVAAPVLESAPTAKMILEPVLGLLDDFKKWSAPSHGGACPRAQLQVFGSVIAVEAYCDIANAIGPELRLAMLAAFAALATLIILSA